MTDTRSEYLHLARLYLPVGLAVFALVALAVLVAVVRFRAREDDGPLDDSPASESRRIEPVWVAVVAAIVAVLLVVTYRTETKVDALAARPALTVRIIVAQWTWSFAYAGTRVVQRTG